MVIQAIIWTRRRQSALVEPYNHGVANHSSQVRAAMMQFQGEKSFSLPPAEVWAKIADARFLLSCVPGVETVSLSEADRAAFMLRPGFSFVRGALEVQLTIVERKPETGMTLHLSSKGIGSSSEVEARLCLGVDGMGSRLQYVADVKNLGGLLKAVPKTLIQGAAHKVIVDALNVLEGKLKG